VILLHGGKVGPHPRFECAGKRDGAVFVAFPVVDVKDSAIQIEVFHPQAEDLALPHSGAIGKFGNEPPRVFEVGEHDVDFVAGEDGRGASLSSAADDEIQLKRVAESIMGSGQKDEGVECLPLGGGRALLLEGDILQIGVDGIGSQGLDRFAKAAEAEVGEPTNPTEVGLFGRGSVATGAAQPSHSVEEVGDDFVFAGEGSSITPPELVMGEAGMADGNGVAEAQGMIVFKKTAPICDGLPVEIRRPSRHPDTATPEFHGKERLFELPVLEAGGGADVLEKAKGRGLGNVSAFAKPAIDPSRNMRAGDVADPGMRGDHVVESIPSFQCLGEFVARRCVHANLFHDRASHFKKKLLF
jgi:hypothetical protein